MISDQLVLRALSLEATLTKEMIEQLQVRAAEQHRPLSDIVLSEHVMSEVDLYTQIAKAQNLPLIDLSSKQIAPEVLLLIPGPLAEDHHVIAFDKDEEMIHIAISDPEDVQTIEFVRRKTGLAPKVFVATDSAIRDALGQYHANLAKEIFEIEKQQQRDSEKKPVDLSREAEELPVVNIVRKILEHAVFSGASDIHIEPVETELVVRYRVDGELRKVMAFPKKIQNGITARLKILALLKIDEHMVPQDGRFTIVLNNEKFSFRVSVIPVYDGEKIVLRLLKEGQRSLTLDELGFLSQAKAHIIASIEKPHGMILVTGPTGSGKTTTLYSMLGILNTPGVNISTIEDPIEYHVEGVNQSQINPRIGFTFASGLRAFLRQDPDIIMVGEIRDQETAEIAIHAAMTGHLVLSTLHTNDAPTTIPRLLNMDIPPFLVAFTLNIIVAQRLVRKICQECKEVKALTKQEIAELTTLVDMPRYLSFLKQEGVEITEAERELETFVFYRGRAEGCAACGETGYKGRIGIYEVLPITKSIEQKINERATAQEIAVLAREEGMIGMFEDGLIKAKMGITTVEEVLRSTRD